MKSWNLSFLEPSGPLQAWNGTTLPLQVTKKVSVILTLNLLTTTRVAPPSNASKWQMGFNSAFKGLSTEGFGLKTNETFPSLSIPVHYKKKRFNFIPVARLP